MHIGKLDGGEGNVFEKLDIKQAWKRYGGESFLEALASGVPMADVLA